VVMPEGDTQYGDISCSRCGGGRDEVEKKGVRGGRGVKGAAGSAGWGGG